MGTVLQIAFVIVIHTLVAASSFCCNQAQAQDHTYHETPPSTPDKPTKLYGKVDIITSSCANAGITLSSSTLPAKIDGLRLGSPAYYAGIRKDDKVLSAKIVENKLNLILERKGQKFSARLLTVATALKDDLAPLAATVSDTSKSLRNNLQQLKNPELYSGWLKNTYPELYGHLSKMDKVSVLDVEGSYDETAQTLDAFGIPYTRVSPEDVVKTSFNDVVAIIINCPGNLSLEAVKKVNDFVCNGGYLLTTDWSADHFDAKAFPGNIDWNSSCNKRPDYDVHIVGKNPALFKNIPANASWHLDGGCHLLKITGPRVTVLAKSEQLAAEDPKSDGVLAVTFKVERGQVLHLVGHFGGSSSGDLPDAAPSIGISLRQAIAGNFIMQALSK
ncbi:MAG: hypothetical protein K2W82_08230 [Candidatus Obscuribacterales bacterium]|nr:hypothetical protein [Candidatus Obscuribacterales bacterium]